MNWTKAAILILTLRCEAASALASQELDEPLTAAERLALRGHLLACRSCRAFRRQLRLIREAARRAGPALDPDAVGGLSPEGRARIARALRDAGAGGDELSTDPR